MANQDPSASQRHPPALADAKVASVETTIAVGRPFPVPNIGR